MNKVSVSVKIKRLNLLVALALVISFLFSCGAADHAGEIKSKLLTPFEYEVQTDEFAFKYKKENGKATMTLTNPQTLEGLELVKTSSGITASYDGLVVTLPGAASAKLFALDTLVDKVVKAIDDNLFTVSTSNGETALKVIDGEKIYTVYYDSDIGKITTAEIAQGSAKTAYSFMP
ncbi:MAG: hypothetical protein WCR95_03585 [Eubacteriales bacterium]|jgi:hypothetical protein